LALWWLLPNLAIVVPDLEQFVYNLLRHFADKTTGRVSSSLNGKSSSVTIRCHHPLPSSAAIIRCHHPLPSSAAIIRCHHPLPSSADSLPIR
jgi:hypothetical protein